MRQEMADRCPGLQTPEPPSTILVELPPKTTARLSAASPATNLATIARLVGASEIQAIFDPYLENKTFATLTDILSLGASVSDNVRLLAGAKMAQRKRPRLTKTFAALWFTQSGVEAGEVRLMSSDEHRRFMLLSGGKALIFGMSLNSIAKNEAAHLEPDTEDRAFFESMWAAATPL